MGKNTKYSKLIKHLRGLANGSIKPVVESGGICLEIKLVCSPLDIGNAFAWASMVATCIKIMLKHPESTGSAGFPIPHPTLSPHNAFNEISNLWDKRTIYGKRRLAMCDYVADKLEEMK